MTRFEMVELLKEIDEKLLCEVDLELHDLARELAHYSLESVIEHLQENACDERG